MARTKTTNNEFTTNVGYEAQLWQMADQNCESWMRK